jgi:hypothetical protein
LFGGGTFGIGHVCLDAPTQCDCGTQRHETYFLPFHSVSRPKLVREIRLCYGCGSARHHRESPDMQSHYLGLGLRGGGTDGTLRVVCF